MLQRSLSPDGVDDVDYKELADLQRTSKSSVLPPEKAAAVEKLAHTRDYRWLRMSKDVNKCVCQRWRCRSCLQS